MLRFQVSNKRQQLTLEHAEGPIELGRGGQRGGVRRCTINDNYVSKDHAHLEELPGGKIRIVNLSTRNRIRLALGEEMSPGEQRELALPLSLSLGETTVIVDLISAADQQAEAELERSLLTIAAPPPVSSTLHAHESLLALGQAPSPERLAEWFETVVAILRAAAGSAEFYARTAAAVVSVVGLDRALVLLRPEGRWTVMARFPDTAFPPASEFSYTILNRVEKERRTFFQSEGIAAVSTSIQGVEAVVASPIFGPKDQVVGVLYGCRTRHVRNRGLGIGALDAQVMQLLASTLGVGLARQQHEAEVQRLRGRFEQFFSARLAAELERNPRLLEGQERPITVLASDIRNFSQLAEQLGPRDSCLLVSDVMERLCFCVEEQEGVVVDYSGDAMMAMWNAPADQPEHVSQACRAALSMLEELPALSSRWSARLNRPLQLGVGLNTGPALCGNIGSTHKFKYGPLGHAVNVAARVEGATKQLGVPLLITGSTQALLRGPYQSRRLCKARVVGIKEAVDLYELHFGESITPQWVTRCLEYENALQLYESGKFSEACRVLANVLAAQSDKEQDGPSLSLMARAIDALKSPPDSFDGVLELHRK